MKRKLLSYWWGSLDSNILMRLSLSNNCLLLLISFFVLGLSSAGPGVSSARANNNNHYYSTSSGTAAATYEHEDQLQQQQPQHRSDRRGYSSSSSSPIQGNQFTRRTSYNNANGSGGGSGGGGGNKNNMSNTNRSNNQNHVLNLNLTFLQDFELGCPQYCAEQSQHHYNAVCINQGCKQWKTGLREGCSSVCRGTEGNFREHYGCQVGCTKAIEDYYFRITGLLGVADPPFLVSDSLNSTSLQLSWEGSYPELPYLVFTIQRRLYRRNHQWETISTQPLNQTVFTAQELTPYTEYQFRIGWILAHDFPPFYSLESNPIATLPEGLPNPPEITSIQPISNTSVSVTWIPPSQPNGRLVAYILTLQKLPDGHSVIKEIPMVHNPRGYTFTSLSPNTNYSLSISAQNQEGVGNATNTHFVTPQSSVGSDLSKRPEPRLLLQGARDVYLRRITDLLLEPDVIVYAPGQNISAIAAHMKYKWVFIATADGQVVRTTLEKNQTVPIIPRERLDIRVTFMSVDWLHNKLFLVGQMKKSPHWVIKRCELDGQGLTNIYPYLGVEPLDFLADPFTGYLYWVSRPSNRRNVSGLYKMDMLSDSSDPIPILESEGGELGPFTVDFATYRILIVHKGKNTVLSVSLDGDVTDIRKNTQRSQFGDALSIGMYNGLLYWTTGDRIVVEEYYSAVDSFFQNAFSVPKYHQPCTRLLILHPDQQPVPVPMAPPLLPQVVMGTRQARVSWRPPAVIAGLGKDAWTTWKYQIRVSDNTSVSNINGTQYVLKNLKPLTEYSIQVLAYSSSGRGPLSPPVTGKTLRQTAFNISLLWASQTGIYSTDVLGDDVQLLVPADEWAGAHNGGNKKQIPYISSLAWYGPASLYFALSNGSVFHFDAETKPTTPKRVLGISYAQSIAFDYIGQKLYWSNPKQQMILRCGVGNCDDSSENMEWLHLITMAKDIGIDSARAMLVWSTGHSLEVSRLNGYSHSVLYQTGLFSGVQITGFTLDTEQYGVYFVTRSSAGSVLLKMVYNIRSPQTAIEMARFDDVSPIGPIRFFNDRIFCLQGSSHSILLDVSGKSKARAALTVDTISNVTNIHVRDESILLYPSGKDKNTIQILPSAVPNWSVKLSGKWNNFTIEWQPVSNINYGRLFYEIVVNNTLSRVTPNNYTVIQNNTLFPPHSEIEISIVAVNYWATSKPTTVRKQIPSAKPSEPKNVRVFVERLSPVYRRARTSQKDVVTHKDTLKDSDTVIAELRWDAPERPNGNILSYVIHCWADGVKKSNCMCLGDVKQLSCQMENLPRNATYQFAVQAYTDAGAGNVSRTTTADLGFDYPVPRMLLTTSDKLEIFDVDRNSVQPIALGVLSPISSVYLAVEESIYWINEGQDLMRSHLYSGNKTRILSLSSYGEASHLAVDWIGRRLFWAMEFRDKVPDKYAIMALDMTSVENVINPTPTVIMTFPTPLKGITVDPFNSVLLWTASKLHGITTIFASRTDGSSPTQFLSRDHVNCNCSNCSSVGEPITFDPSGFGSLKRGFLMTNDKSIYLTDESGCDCLPLINMTAHGFSWSRTPPYKLAGNHRHIYWSAGYIYASEKLGNGVTELMPSGIREISLLGPSSQPFPDLNCLIPRKLKTQSPSLFNHSSYSVHLELPMAELVNCDLEDVSLAALKYRVFYGTVNENSISECTPTSISHCVMITTSERLLHINDLAPYTIYTVFVSVTNIYAEMEGIEPLACSPTIFRTAAGAPTPPKLLRLEPLTPTSVRVVWRRPDKLNGERVWYEINWKPEKSRISPGPGWTEVEVPVGMEWYNDSKHNESHTEFHWIIYNKLQPACNYTIWVAAFSEKGDAFSVSENMTVRTYPNPSNVTLLSATPHTLNLRWEPPPPAGAIVRHQIVYRVGWESIWNSTNEMDTLKLAPPYNFTISDLKPKTEYGFKVKAWYAADPENPYYWPKNSYGQFTIETLADKPGSPGEPVPRNTGKGLYEVSWDRAEDNGAKVEIYSLECRLDVQAVIIHQEEETTGKMAGLKRRKRQSRKMEVAEKLVAAEKESGTNVRFPRWKLVYNGTEPRWQVEDLEMDAPYSFRVRAKNRYGWGEYSKEKAIESLVSLTPGVAEPQSLGVILGVIGSSLMILAVLASVFFIAYRRKVKEKPALQSPSSSERREVELATLRELPGGSSFIHQSNILYAASDLILDLELAGVRQIGRHQISFTKFLGSGAFGEVYEGMAVNLQDSTLDDNTRVAIKTLRKGASANEKLEFIQEAKLMTQFRHPHILQLLGICIDTDPCCLLLELMDGGDLLSYLRSNRPHLGSSVVLRMSDLLKMCLDVAKGCVYLEEMHFVHRDLAARNCLVRLVGGSVTDNGDLPGGEALLERVVKIGDFGLARDVYRNDYYRKEGEGLLPVRWMAPESLIDGVYTTQSDVWAFGVLLWEILTLGQQPYPARNNLEVLHYVRAGGRLQQPPRCPPRLSELMLRCWEFNADNRPTFKDCLNQVELILREFECGVSEQSDPNIASIESAISQLHHYNNYLQPASESKSNSYYQRQCSDSAAMSVPTTSTYAGPLLPSQEEELIYADSGGVGTLSFPRYLQVLSEPNSSVDKSSALPFATTDEGYEIPLPRKPPRNPQPLITPVRHNAPSSDLGLPSPSYWNTRQHETTTMFPYEPSYEKKNESNPRLTRHPTAHYELTSPTKPRDKYVRRPGDMGNPGMDSPTNFRNLLASTTSEDADVDGDMDYSECDLGSPHREDVFREMEPGRGGLPDASVPLGRLRTTRFPVSLSDSSNGSGDTCTEEAEVVRVGESSESELQTVNPEYLSMVCRAGNLNRFDNNINNNNNNSGKCRGYLDGGRGQDYLISNGYIYDDARDMRFASAEYPSGRPPPLPNGYRYHSHSISGGLERGSGPGSCPSHITEDYHNRSTLKMGSE